MLHIYNALYRMFAYLPPSIIAAGALINGIICSALHQLWLLPLFCLTGTEVLHNLQRISRTVAFLVLMSISCCGALSFLMQRTTYLEHIQAIPKGLCLVRGTILDGGSTKSHAYPYYVDVRTHYISSLAHDTTKFDTPIVIRILLQHKDDLYEQGSSIEWSSVMIFKERQENGAHHQAKNNLNCCGKMTQESAVRIIQAPSHTLGHTICTIKQKIISAARSSFSPTTFTLIAAIFFGYATPQEHAHIPLREAFGWWGLNHLLARSGLHLTIFILLFGLLLGLIPLPSWGKHVFMLSSIGFYLLLSWPSISFMRAVAMAGWYIACLSTATAPHPLHIIACVSMGALLYQPYYLFGLDFQLSFALTFALALISHATRMHSQQTNC